MSALLLKRCVFGTFQFRNILVVSAVKQQQINAVRLFWRSRSRNYKYQKWKMGMSVIGGGSLFCLSLPFLKNEHELFESKNSPPEQRKVERGPYNVPISRKVDGPNKLKVKLTLFQYQNCPFCCKVRAFLDYYGIPYDVVEVSPIFKTQLHFSEYKKVPIVVVEDKPKHYRQLNDSSTIVSMLGTYLLDPEREFQRVLDMYPRMTDGRKTEVTNRYHVMFGERHSDGKSDREIREEIEWRKWTDDDLVHALSPNIYRTLKESYQSFCYFSVDGDWNRYFGYLERKTVVLLGSAAMYLVARRLKTKYGLEEDVRESLYQRGRAWMKGAVVDKRFAGGERPNLADLAVFGVLSSIRGCQAFRDLMRDVRLSEWYSAVEEAVAGHRGGRT